MNSVAFQIAFNLLKRKNVQISLLISLIGIGVFTKLGYQNFLYLQAQNISKLSVFNEIIKPLSGLVFITQLFIICMTTSQILPYFFNRGQQGLMLHSTLSNKKLIGVLFLSTSALSLLPLIYFVMICAGFLMLSGIDIWLITSTTIAMLLAQFFFTLVILMATMRSKKTMTSLIFSIVAILFIFGLDEILRSNSTTRSLSIYLNMLTHMRDGLIIPTEILRFLCWGLFFFSLSLLKIQTIRLSSYRSSIMLISFSLLAFTGIYLVENRTIKLSIAQSRWDISQSNLNSLDSDFVQQVKSLEHPIIITAVIDDEIDHDEVKKAFDIINQYQPNSSLSFSNRQALSNQSDQVAQFVTVEINHQQLTIRYPFAQNAKDSISQVINQLTTRSNRWITFIEGHNEASPFGTTNKDITLFYQSLKDLGWSIAIQNLSKQPTISSNTKVIIIAASKTQWLPMEQQKLMNYLEKGGNLLLLREPEDQLPPQLENFLAINKASGTLIDWQGYQSGTPHPAILIINQFVPHPINTNIKSLLAFPWSSGLIIEEKNKKPNNEYQSIIKSHIGVWTEFDIQKSELSYNPEKGEIRQAFDLAYSIKNKDNGQRIIVTGDSSFISDSSINNYANKQFGLNLISWLMSQKSKIVVKEYQDSFIHINPTGNLILNWLFSVLIPAMLFGAIILYHLNIFRRSKDIG